MSNREYRIELEVSRPVKIRNINFLPTARRMAGEAFGERTVGVTTLRRPLVAIDEISGTTEPLARINDAKNLRIPLLSRVSVGDKNAGSKFYKANRALEDGVLDKTKRQKGASEYKVAPLQDRIAAVTGELGIYPKSSFVLKCAGIEWFESDLMHPGTVIFGLVPVANTDAEKALVAEQAMAEKTLGIVSEFAARQANPLPEGIILPFMRVYADHTPEQRQMFIDSIVIPNLFPLVVEVQPLEIAFRS